MAEYLITINGFDLHIQCDFMNKVGYIISFYYDDELIVTKEYNASMEFSELLDSIQNYMEDDEHLMTN